MSNRKNSWNYIDEFGIMVGKNRIENESNKDFHKRLKCGTIYDSTKQGMSNMLHELVGSDAVNVVPKGIFVSSTTPPLTQNEKFRYSNNGTYNNPIVVDNYIEYNIRLGAYYGVTSGTVTRMKATDGITDLTFIDRDEITIGTITWRLWKYPESGLYTRIFSSIQIPSEYTTSPQDFLRLSLEEQNKYITNVRNVERVSFMYDTYKDNVIQAIEESGIRLTKDSNSNVIEEDVE